MSIALQQCGIEIRAGSECLLRFSSHVAWITIERSDLNEERKQARKFRREAEEQEKKVFD